MLMYIIYVLNVVGLFERFLVNILDNEVCIEIVDNCCNGLCIDFCNLVVDEVIYFGRGVCEMY